LLSVTSASVRIDPGTAVGPYVIERQLAQGGMSVIYLARDGGGARVVIKMLLPEIATTAMRSRMQREARALAAVDHLGVVRVHETGEHLGAPWIAMDYVRGHDLKRLLADRGAFTPEAAVQIAIDACEALDAAHGAGVIHRDLKPSNLVMTPEGRVVLVDFGIAKKRGEPRDGDVVTSSREILGTLAYQAPEQLEHGLADERSDIWSLGCVLFEMLAAEPPFGRGGSGTTAAILRDEPVFPPAVPATLVQIIGACLRKSSFARVASVRELLVMLRDAHVEARTKRSSMRPSAHPPANVSANVSTSVSANVSANVSPSVSGMPARSPSSASITSPSSSSSSVPPAKHASSAMRVATARGRIKGAALRAGIAWFGEMYGEPGMARVAELASPALAQQLRKDDPAFGIIASGWYDTALVGELLALLDQVASPAEPEAFRAKVAEAIARDNVHGVYRALFRLVASPPLLEANANRVWRTYVDEGALVVALRGPGSFEGRVRGWAHHDPVVCRMIQSMFEALLRAVGYAGLVVERTECVGEGAPHCLFEGEWLP
jgi:serine/threonine protein kinase